MWMGWEVGAVEVNGGDCMGNVEEAFWWSLREVLGKYSSEIETILAEKYKPFINLIIIY